MMPLIRLIGVHEGLTEIIRGLNTIARDLGYASTDAMLSRAS